MDLNFKKIELNDKPLFDNYLSKFPQDSSELTFTNLFVFKDSKKIEFCEYKNHLIISFIDQNGKRLFYTPIGENILEIISEILTFYSTSSFERINQQQILWDNNLNNNLFIERDRANDDYIYQISDLVTLHGQKYANKRNFVKRFEKNEFTLKIIDPSIIKKCLDLEEAWCNLKQCKKDKSLCAEYLAIKNAFNNYNYLELFGIAVLVKEKVVGFAIGEKLNNNTFVEHFEKASDDFIGAYQFLLNSFAKEIQKQFPKMIYLNREQDLGIEGMRKAKESYHPIRMIEKVKIKKN